MSDWQHCTLGELVKFKGGSVFPKDAQGLTSGDLPFAKVSDMTAPANWRSLAGAENWLSVDQAKKLKATIHEPGAVAFAKIGIALTYNRRRQIVRPTLLDNNMMSAKAHPGKIDSKFLYYLLQTIDFNEVSAGSALPYLTIGTLGKIAVSVPCMAEQRNIALLLGSLDDKIELNRRMNDTLEVMAQAIFRDWFVDFGPTRRKIDGMTDPTEIMGGMVADPDRARELAALFPAKLGHGGLPEGWRDGVLGDLVASIVDRCKPSADTEARPYVPIDTITARSLVIEGVRPGAEAQSSLVRFRRGDILFGAMRPYFHKVALADFDGTTRTTVFVLRPKHSVDLCFSLMVVNDNATIDYATQHSSGTTIPYAVWRNSLERMPVSYPPLDIRSAYGSVVEPMLSRMQASASQNEAISTTRDLLLPKLMSGEIRIRDAEAALEAAQ